MNQKVKSTVEALKEWSSEMDSNCHGDACVVLLQVNLTRHKILTGSRVRDDEGNTLPLLAILFPRKFQNVKIIHC